MFIALIRLFRLIGQIFSGEKFESPDKPASRLAFFILATTPLFFFFWNWLHLSIQSQNNFLPWIIFIAVYCFVWAAVGKRIPLFISLPLTLMSWSLLLWFVWKY
jgi:hypothetical protein